MKRLLRDVEPDRRGRKDRADKDEDRPEPIGLELVARTRVENEVANAREKMLEERPSQADKDDFSKNVGDLMEGPGVRIVPDAGNKGGIGLGPRGNRAKPPEEKEHPGNRESVAGYAMEDRDRHRRCPFIYSEVRRERSPARFPFSHISPVSS